jgi:hypothetical protein
MIDLSTFFDHVFYWAETLWQDRVEATAVETTAAEQVPEQTMTRKEQEN